MLKRYNLIGVTSTNFICRGGDKMIAYNFNTSRYGILDIHIFDTGDNIITSYICRNYHKKIAPNN